MLTLNQTIEIFKNFSLNHKQLGKGTNQSNFYFGNEPEIEAAYKAQYPLMWVSLLPTTVDPIRGGIVRKFQIDISDLVNQDISNRTHVLSDCEQICIDLINYIDSLDDSIVMNIGNVSELTDYTEKRNSDVTGWYFTLEVKSHQEGTSCNLPIINGNIFDGNYIYINGFSGAGCSPVLIKDQDGNTLQTFTNGGTYTVTVVSSIDGGDSTTIFTNVIIPN